MRPVRQLYQEDGSGGSVMVLRLRVAGTRQPLFLRVHQELLRPGGKNMRSAAATGPFNSGPSGTIRTSSAAGSSHVMSTTRTLLEAPLLQERSVSVHGRC